jgi:hypothetical protein
MLEDHTVSSANTAASIQRVAIISLQAVHRVLTEVPDPNRLVV